MPQSAVKIKGNIMQEQYRPDLIEAEVQQYWAENKTFKAIKDTNKPKYYCLSMFLTPLVVCTWDMCVTTPLVM